MFTFAEGPEIYKGYEIDFDIYGDDKFNVMFNGTWLSFLTEEEAKRWIDNFKKWSNKI